MFVVVTVEIAHFSPLYCGLKRTVLHFLSFLSIAVREYLSLDLGDLDGSTNTNYS